MNINNISKYCLTLPEKPERIASAMAHFKESGLEGVRYFPGINGKVMGLKTIFPYAVDDRSGNFFCGHHEVGIALSHISVWTHIMMNKETAIVLEDDAKLLPGWKDETNRALGAVPDDFDFLFLGSCGAVNAQKTHYKENVFDVRYPSCYHFYVVSPKGAEKLVLTQRKIFGPIDLMPYVLDPFGGSVASYHQMKVYTVLPRVAEQFNTDILE